MPILLQTQLYDVYGYDILSLYSNIAIGSAPSSVTLAFAISEFIRQNHLGSVDTVGCNYIAFGD